MAEMGISLSSTTWAFSIAILFLGLSAAFLGKFVERIGPRASGLLSMLFFCSGLIGTALAVSMKSVALLYFFYGAVGGIGLGIWLYHAGFNFSQMVPRSPRICNRPGHYGVRLCFAHRRAAHAKAHGPSMDYQRTSSSWEGLTRWS